MTERRSRRRKREDEDSDEEEDGASDEQTEIAKYLRFNCETKSSNFKSQKVEYFKGSKAIDCLLDSKWASGKGGTEILFTDRESVRDYLKILLEMEMFKRVTRVRKKKKGEKDEGKKGTKDSPKPGKSKKDTSDGKNGESEGKKIKVKVKLEIHELQEFFDGEEVYMWIFDPVHPRTIIYGVLVVIGAIVMCLFPLWPPQMREYTWYISVGLAILLGALIVVALLRYVLFGFVWLITVGKHRFWLLPNLTEDCGFFESFVPLYTHSYSGTMEEDDGKTEKPDDKDGNEGTSKDKQEEGNEDERTPKDTKDEEEKRDHEGNEGTSEGNEDEHLLSRPKGQHEAESWINVTEEDVAQAKQATGNKSDNETMTSPVAC